MAKKTINVIYKVDDKELEQAKATISGVEKEAKDADKAVKDFGNESKKAGDKAKTSFGGFGKVIAAVSLVVLAKQIFDFGVKVANVTAEFQKFEAVLTNTLGSKSKAQAALAQIKQFAATTPFSVQELTASFVKLANQGFVPTREEMRKLGDLSASTGKQFDMLTEAIIDAQTGEFERLKEFGIRASKEGDKVTFTFKGVQTQTDFTADSIRKYVLSLGDMAGVSGSMAAISQTLGGKISNLGDAWDTFLTTVGAGNDGILTGTVTLLSKAIEKATELLKTDAQQAQQTASTILDKFKALDTELAKEEFKNKIYEEQFKLTVEKAKAEKDYHKAFMSRDMDSAKIYRQDIALLTQRLDTIKISLGFINDFTEAEKEKAIAEENDKNKVKELTEEEKRRLEQFNKANKAMEGVVDAEIELARIRERIAEERKTQLWGIEKTINDGLLEAAAEFHREDLDLLKESDKKLEEQQKQHADNILSIRQYVFDQSLDLIAQLLLADNNRIQNSIDLEKYNADQQTLLAGDNERKKTEIKIESDRRIAELQKQQNEREKQQITKRILIEGALNAVKALGLPPVPGANFVAAGLALAQALAQAAVTRSVGFKDGVIDLQGPGTTKSDSINARLSRGESVITAEATSSSRNLLEAIQNRKIDDSVLNKMSKSGGAQVNVFDDKAIIKAIKEGKTDTKREAYTLYETKQVGSNLRIKTRSKIQGYK